MREIHEKYEIVLYNLFYMQSSNNYFQKLLNYRKISVIQFSNGFVAKLINFCRDKIPRISLRIKFYCHTKFEEC